MKLTSDCLWLWSTCETTLRLFVIVKYLWSMDNAIYCKDSGFYLCNSTLFISCLMSPPICEFKVPFAFNKIEMDLYCAHSWVSADSQNVCCCIFKLMIKIRAWRQKKITPYPSYMWTQFPTPMFLNILKHNHRVYEVIFKYYSSHEPNWKYTKPAPTKVESGGK